MDDEDQGQPALTGAEMASSANFNVELAASVVLVFDESLVPARARKRHRQRNGHPFRSVRTLANGIDIVVASGPGSPVAAVTVEFLAALGADRVVIVGTAGALRSAMARTHVVGRAVSDEGTSLHYGNHLEPNPRLTQELAAQFGVPTSVTLTTDVPFRHTPERLRSHRAVADLVEMECAAMFSAARTFSIEAAALLIVSDVFDENRWYRVDAAQTRKAIAEALAVTTNVLGGQR